MREAKIQGKVSMGGRGPSLRGLYQCGWRRRIKKGLLFGETDEIGYSAIKGKVHFVH